MGSKVESYFPVQRIAQACLQCRRKKCRCTGDRPVCGQCQRLSVGQDCVYPVEASRPQAVRQQAPCRFTEQESDRARETGELSRKENADVVNKITTLEAKIENMGSSLQRIERCLVSLLDGSDQGGMGLPAPSGQVEGSSGIEFPTSEQRNRFEESQNSDTMKGDFGLPEEVFMAVVDSYFTYCQNQPYSFFHEQNFRQRLSKQDIPRHLVLAVMATAVRFCSHPYFTGPWVKVGLAVRMAQDCGLMLENATHLSYAEQEERRRVFWSVYLLDRLVSCGRGRPPAIVDASCHVQLPCAESIWRDGLWAKTQSLDEMTNRTLSVAQRQGPFAQVIAIAHVLGRCAQYVLQDFNIRGPHPPWDPGSDFAGIESDLLHFEAYLEIQRPVSEMLEPHISAEGVVDSQSTGPIIFSRALFHLCYCLLNHPFLLRRRINTCRNLAPISFIQRSSNMAWLHAQQMMALIREARKSGCSFHSSSSGYAVTVAGSIIALRTYDADSIASEQAQILLEEALLYLDIIGQHWSNVRTMVMCPTSRFAVP
ncbi:fungal-specific transcription factor domain-containing protein [Apiospora marii]|uniref:Fungal-specific transcription factor domain-containing protein n=1 Tax=Apiospora marii TaxID=335849 RepID=A0ABR1RB15_9PEZI